MIATWLALAKTKLSTAPRGWDPRLLWTTLALAAIIVVGAGLVALLDRWRKRAAPAIFDANDQLAHFRELYDKGELSQEEFERIRERLGQQIRQDLKVPTAPAEENLKVEQPAKNGQAAPPHSSESGPESPGAQGEAPGQH